MEEGSQLKFLIHYYDELVVLINGVNVNRLDTYNVAIQDLTIFSEKNEFLETIAELQFLNSIKYSPSDLEISEILPLGGILPAGCLSASVNITYICREDKNLDVSFNQSVFRTYARILESLYF